jgi:hypothetical protein
MRPASRGRGLLVLLMVGGLAAACSKEKESLILVTLTADGNAAGVRSLILSAEGTVKTFDLPTGLPAGPATATYGLYVPSGVDGSVDVNASALTPTDCTKGYTGQGRTSSFKVGETGAVSIKLKSTNLCGVGGTGGGGTTGTAGASGTTGTAGASGTTGTAGASGTTGTGGSVAGTGGSTPGCTGTVPSAGTPPSLTCCTEYDHTLQGACDANDTFIYQVAFSPDGTRLVSGGDDGRYVFWNFDGHALTPEGHTITGGVYGYGAFSPDGATLAAGGSDVHLFGIGTWSDKGSLAIDYTSYGVSWAADGQRIVDIDDTNLYVHSVATLSQIAKVALPHIPWAMAASAGSNGGAIGVALPSTSGYATIYTITGQATVGAPLDVPVSANELWSAAFSANGTQLAIGGYDSFVDVWNFPLASASDQPAIKFSIDEPAELEDVQGMAFSPNGRYLAVASGFNTGHASVWDLTTKTLVGRWTLPSRYAISVAFSPSGNAIAVGEHGCGKFLLCTE